MSVSFCFCVSFGIYWNFPNYLEFYCCCFVFPQTIYSLGAFLFPDYNFRHVTMLPKPPLLVLSVWATALWLSAGPSALHIYLLCALSLLASHQTGVEGLYTMHSVTLQTFYFKVSLLKMHFEILKTTCQNAFFPLLLQLSE